MLNKKINELKEVKIKRGELSLKDTQLKMQEEQLKKEIIELAEAEGIMKTNDFEITLSSKFTATSKKNYMNERENDDFVKVKETFEVDVSKMKKEDPILYKTYVETTKDLKLVSKGEDNE